MITVIPGNYINEYYGLNTDDKPDDEHVPNASLFYEMDTGDVYVYDKENETWINQTEF